MGSRSFASAHHLTTWMKGSGLMLTSLLACVTQARGAGSVASDARVAKLEANVRDMSQRYEADVRDMNRRYQDLSMRYAELNAEMDAMKAMLLKLTKAAGDTSNVAGSKLNRPAGDIGSSKKGIAISQNTSKPTVRQLSTPSYTAVPSLQLHEFPNGHTCSTGSLKYVLPVKNSQPTWVKSPSDVDTDVALVSVGSSWETTTIQSFPAPLKVVHNDACDSEPSLHLQLQTTVSQLTVGAALLNGADLSMAILLAGARTIIPSSQTGLNNVAAHLWVNGDGVTLYDRATYDIMESARNKWIFIPVPGTNFYNIKSASSVSSLYRDNNWYQYISTSADGVVGCWHTDTGDGSQRWKIEKVSGTSDNYNIRISGGTNSGKDYLGVESDDQTIALVAADDGGGRQRWSIV